MPLNNCTRARCPLQDVVECSIEECPYKTEPLEEMSNRKPPNSTSNIYKESLKIDVRHLVKHGHWNLDGTCSVCGKHTLQSHGNFCCYCGADMRGETE